jgi:uncharacterized protein
LRLQGLAVAVARGNIYAYMQAVIELNDDELRRYLERISDRWRLDGAYVSARASDAKQKLTGEPIPGFTVILISDAFDEIPWLERVYVATSLWDASEMGAKANVLCYTQSEFERRDDGSPAARWAQRASEQGRGITPAS